MRVSNGPCARIGGLNACTRLTIEEIQTVVDSDRIKGLLANHNIRLQRMRINFGKRPAISYLYREGNGLNQKHAVELKEVTSLQATLLQHVELCHLLLEHGLLYTP
eukprot:SAG11_NODE_98_length_16927_cov_35.166211_13_plen_106_part_00